MSARRRASGETVADSGSQAFTVSFTSFSLILLAFFIFLDAISVPDRTRQTSVVDALGSEFESSRLLEKPETPAAIVELAEEAAFQVTRQDDQYLITMPGAALFESADANIRQELLPTLHALAEKIANQELQVRIEGHTDSIPIATERFESNWELSAARAVAVLRLFLHHGIPPERLSAVGRAEFHPVADNATEMGRALNRRVVLRLSQPVLQKRWRGE
ncbi:MAG: OmpA family protein [Bdellovibrionales bacterium]|nr:OmpA family protein [Bdellovibrionales bacterium]